jgi:glycosyltransferase involved in cell wall biosynthesis
VAPRDAEALARAVTALLADEPERARLGAAARARVEERFTLDRMADGIAAVYAELGVTPRRGGSAA